MAEAFSVCSHGTEQLGGRQDVSLSLISYACVVCLDMKTFNFFSMIAVFITY
jgi:hypothetical protein